MNHANAEVYVDLYRSGKLGTPENPVRGSTSKDTFWKVYFGFRKASEYRNSMVYGAAKAGAAISKEDKA